MVKIFIKPLSVNQSYQGRRFSTPALKAYKYELHFQIPKRFGPIIKGEIAVKYIFGVSSKNADGDNLVKSFQDSLAEKWGFNDRQIYHWDITKVDVKKGKEFIEFEITKL